MSNLMPPDDRDLDREFGKDVQRHDSKGDDYVVERKQTPDAAHRSSRSDLVRLDTRRGVPGPF